MSRGRLCSLSFLLFFIFVGSNVASETESDAEKSTSVQLSSLGLVSELVSRSITLAENIKSIQFQLNSALAKVDDLEKSMPRSQRQSAKFDNVRAEMSELLATVKSLDEHHPHMHTDLLALRDGLFDSAQSRIAHDVAQLRMTQSIVASVAGLVVAAHTNASAAAGGNHSGSEYPAAITPVAVPPQAPAAARSEVMELRDEVHRLTQLLTSASSPSSSASPPSTIATPTAAASSLTPPRLGSVPAVTGGPVTPPQVVAAVPMMTTSGVKAETLQLPVQASAELSARWGNPITDDEVTRLADKVMSGKLQAVAGGASTGSLDDIIRNTITETEVAGELGDLALSV
eukprot:gnl/Spiro4/284_TR174_c0_g1_i1.p1 gnl/Spiro4/284_TR174_c0_g1~~gnl/Spiro4/284_TR174_c0_g1_i1.p1  ORF type:complete len:344 (+),score=77.08 gnl/Spiro4/284_TR174_c0_g1_i1:61-1092(+)